MQSNAVKKTVEAVTAAPRIRAVNDNARRILMQARYQAPSVASYPISGCDQSGPVSMIGNLGAA